MGGITTHRRSLAIVGMALSLILTATACSNDEPGPGPARPDVGLIKSNRLTACADVPYPPFAFTDKGEVVGFDVDILRLVAKKLGVRLKVVDAPFDDIHSGAALKSRTCDLAAAAMSITPARDKVVDFSDGYFDANQAMLVKAGKPYRELKDLNGKKVGVQGETTGAEYARAQQKKQKLSFEIVEYEDFDGEQHALLTGEIEAAINDLPVWSEYLKDEKNLGRYEIATEFDTDEEYGIAVRPGNKKLLGVINDVLAEAKQDGQYDRIYEKWLGKRPGA